MKKKAQILQFPAVMPLDRYLDLKARELLAQPIPEDDLAAVRRILAHTDDNANPGFTEDEYNRLIVAAAFAFKRLEKEKKL